MNFTVLWKPSAEEELARLWTEAENRQTISNAADTIDDLLRRDPLHQGESRSGQTRVVFQWPLVVLCDVVQQDRLVYVLTVRSVIRRRDG